ncbi:hypothetical protein GGX14DRAFT_396782 [Mycena pura]|uniref:Uncharacterized protein n=1 Tax=Mycena pura TaxID=153505 RepID=A0AAD6Y9F1_9AGAR|nr:hypothetical protein GGX14DRAFT_396782 [Mycena pura]
MWEGDEQACGVRSAARARRCMSHNSYPSLALAPKPAADAAQLVELRGHERSSRRAFAACRPIITTALLDVQPPEAVDPHTRLHQPPEPRPVRSQNTPSGAAAPASASAAAAHEREHAPFSRALSTHAVDTGVVGLAHPLPWARVAAPASASAASAALTKSLRSPAWVAHRQVVCTRQVSISSGGGGGHNQVLGPRRGVGDAVLCHLAAHASDLSPKMQAQARAASVVIIRARRGVAVDGTYLGERACVARDREELRLEEALDDSERRKRHLRVAGGMAGSVEPGQRHRLELLALARKVGVDEGNDPLGYDQASRCCEGMRQVRHAPAHLWVGMQQSTSHSAWHHRLHGAGAARPESMVWRGRPGHPEPQVNRKCPSLIVAPPRDFTMGQYSMDGHWFRDTGRKEADRDLNSMRQNFTDVTIRFERNTTGSPERGPLARMRIRLARRVVPEYLSHDFTNLGDAGYAEEGICRGTK